MEFNDVLQQMTEYAQELTLLHMIRDMISFIRTNHNSNFSDLLKTLARYARMEYNKETKEANYSWEVISDLLNSAAEKLDFSRDQLNISAEMDIEIEGKVSDYYRQTRLLNTVSVWTRGLERERCRFSNILGALSTYAEAEARNCPLENNIWDVVANFIKTAANEAERQGRELP